MTLTKERMSSTLTASVAHKVSGIIIEKNVYYHIQSGISKLGQLSLQNDHFYGQYYVSKNINFHFASRSLLDSMMTAAAAVVELIVVYMDTLMMIFCHVFHHSHCIVRRILLFKQKKFKIKFKLL
jgi:hypothetical protein